ncbi:pyridoxamine 5'-phosphate oxidase family protein [Chloroflexota bacterium]
MDGELGKALALKITKKMPPEQLADYIGDKLKQLTVCTLVTSKNDVPRGTPLEYFADGLLLYISPDPGTKVKNLRANPNVNVSIYNNVRPDWVIEWRDAWGIQLTGKAELFEPGDSGYDLAYERGSEVINFGSFFRALGKDYSRITKQRNILRVIPIKIELLEFALIGQGFAFRQTWRAKT